MPWRPTAATDARKREVRAGIIDAAQSLLREGGYAAAQIDDVAARAKIATGTIYRHFETKADLFAEVFRTLTEREVEAMRGALESTSGRPAGERIGDGIAVFARRALRGRRAAWALIAEPVDPAVEKERLVFRRAYASLLAQAIRDGIRAGELPLQDADTTAAALVGGLAEALLGPLSKKSSDDDSVVEKIVTFCRRAIGAKEPQWPPRTKSSTSRPRSTRSTRSRRTRRSSKG